MPALTYDVFISYSHQDLEWARRLGTNLQERKLNVFLDEHRILGGQKWEETLTTSIHQSRHLVVFWSEHARESDWVRRELGLFDAIRFQGAKDASDERRVIFVNLDAENKAFSSVQYIDDIRKAGAYAGGVATVSAALWSAVEARVADAVRLPPRGTRIPLAIVAMTLQTLAALNRGLDPGWGRTFSQTVQDLGFAPVPGGGPVEDSYGATPADWRPFGGPRTIGHILDEILDRINKLVPPGYFWDPIDLLGDLEPTKDSMADLCSGPSVIVVDPLSLYDLKISYRFRQLQQCVGSEHVLMAVCTPLSVPTIVTTLRDLTRKIATPVIDAYYAPPVPYKSHALFAVNVGDENDADRLVRNCLGRHMRKSVATPGSPYLQAGQEVR